MQWMWKSGLGLALAMLSWAVAAADIRVDGAVVSVRGTLVTGDAEKFEAALSDAVTMVQIRSPGGLLEEALRMGRAIWARKLDVEVKGMCASACSQLILPAAKEVRLDNGSVVAMHAAGMGAYYAWHKENPEPPPPAGVAEQRVLQALEKLRQDMEDFRQVVGIRQEAWNFMFDLTSLRGVRLQLEDKGAGNYYLSLSSQRPALCGIWLLDEQALKDFGVRAQPWKPAGRLKASIMLMEKYDSFYDGPLLPLERLQNLPHCAALRELGEAHR